MGRKILLAEGTGNRILEETTAEDEAQLQELLKNNPTLLPIEDFELEGPVMVVGRETTLASGSVDLISLAPSGDILIVEFKTGPQNADFRHVVAQLLDYGSHLWQMTYDEFENAVALRYFSSDRCPQGPTRGKASLEAAAKELWAIDDERFTTIRRRIEDQLAKGSFRFVVAAQRFTPTMERTVAYLNEVAPQSRFYAVELVRFETDGSSAFEARTILKPEVTRAAARQQTALNEKDFLDAIDDAVYRTTLERLFDTARAQGLRFEWGPSGTSIRLPTADRAEPVSIGWVFPAPGVWTWMGLNYVTLGFDPKSASATPSVMPDIEKYVDQIAAIPGVQPTKTDYLKAYTLEPAVLIPHIEKVLDALTHLVEAANA